VSPALRDARVGLLLLAATASCSLQGDRRAVACHDPAKVVALRNTHYPDLTCKSAVKYAETRLTMAYYVKACQQLAPSAGLPLRVLAARVVACEPASRVAGQADERGVVAQVQICCL